MEKDQRVHLFIVSPPHPVEQDLTALWERGAQVAVVPGKVGVNSPRTYYLGIEEEKDVTKMRGAFGVAGFSVSEKRGIPENLDLKALQCEPDKDRSMTWTFY